MPRQPWRQARRFAEDTRKPVSQLLNTFNDVSAGMAELAVKLDTLSGDTTESVVRLRGILRRLDDLIAERQPDIETTLENIRLISENLKEITDNAKKYPSQFLFGEPPPRYENRRKNNEEKNASDFLYREQLALIFPFDGMLQL